MVVDAKHQGIYLALFSVLEGDSCFSIYQISQIKTKNVTFCKLKTSLRRNFVYNLQTFWGFCQVHFTILSQILHENNFLPTSKQWQAKVRHFLGICLYDCFIYRSNFVFQKCLEPRCHLGSGCKKVNSQGFFELREPTRFDWRVLLFTDLVNTNSRYCLTFCKLRKMEFSEKGHENFTINIWFVIPWTGQKCS